MTSKYYLTFNTKSHCYEVYKIKKWWFIEYSSFVQGEYSLDEAVHLLNNLQKIEESSNNEN